MLFYSGPTYYLLHLVYKPIIIFSLLLCIGLILWCTLFSRFITFDTLKTVEKLKKKQFNLMKRNKKFLEISQSL